MIDKKTFFAALLTLPLLTACGGGGGGGGSDSGSGSGSGSGGGSDSGGGSTDGSGDGGGSTGPDYGTLETGYLLDGATNGLSYETGDQSGVVSEGVLPYYTKDPVVLSLGGSVIGTSTGSLIMPFGALEEGMSNLHADYWKNVAALLLMADDDADANNGISIESAARATAAGYSFDFDTDYATFVSTSGAGLSDIAGSTSAGSRAAPSESTANSWVNLIKTMQSSGLDFSAADLLYFSEDAGFESAFELESDGTGRLDLSGDGALGSNRAGNDFRTINAWGAVDYADYPTEVSGFYLETDAQRVECFPLRVAEDNKVESVCQGDSFDGRYVLADYYALYQGDTETFEVFNESNLWLFDDLGTQFPVAAGNNVFVDSFTFAPGAGTYPNVGSGSWQSGVPNVFDIDATTNDLTFTISGQVGIHGVTMSESETDTGNTKNRFVSIAGTVVEPEDLSGMTFRRYNMGSRSDLGTITLNGDGSTSESGVTWAVVDAGRQVSLSGASYDRCSYSGNVLRNQFFVCDDSSGNLAPARAEYWKHVTQ